MSGAKVMLLIDADNVSIEVIEQTVNHLLTEFGALHGRRAYCNAEAALKHQGTFKRLGIRPMVNLAAGKNSTDIALAVDTMELVMRERPDVLAIASSDSDFAPLVTRVREKGCRVLGFGQDGKTGDSTVALYDRYVQFSSRGVLVEPSIKVEAAPRSAPAKKVAVKATTEAKKQAPTKKTAAAKTTPAKQATTAKKVTPAKKAAATGKTQAETPDPQQQFQRLVVAVPALDSGNAVELNVVGKVLHDLGIVSKNASSVRWLRKFPERFELTPAAQPNKVKLKP